MRQAFAVSYPWHRYSKKISKRILEPKNFGTFSNEEALSKNMRLVIGQEGEVELGNVVFLYWLVDEEDGVIADAKFQVFGQTALIAAADIACELVLRKNYEQARRLSAELLDKQLRDASGDPAFPKECAEHLNLVLFAIDNASDQCMDIPLEETFTSSPVASPSDIPREEYPNWQQLTKEEKIQVIEAVINEEVRPYIELDEGGIKILDLKEDKELIIAYEGNCTSCYSATGATLNAIDQILKNKIHPSLVVVPDLSFLSKELH